MTRAERIMAAARAVDARGEKPTARSVLAEMDGNTRSPNEYPNGMGGADLVAFAAAMEALGYERVQVGEFHWNKRWRKVRTN